jgi:hypothetical protein
LASYSRSSVIIYSDASSVAAGAHTVELDSKVFHTNWSDVFGTGNPLDINGNTFFGTYREYGPS